MPTSHPAAAPAVYAYAVARCDARRMRDIYQHAAAERRMKDARRIFADQAPGLRLALDCVAEAFTRDFQLTNPAVALERAGYAAPAGAALAVAGAALAVA